MAKPFLRSGNLVDVLTLGENGQPVYALAAQLREALRLQQQPAVADCLAIPLPNAQGDRIDWYAPIAGRAISWHAADEQQRAAALPLLEHFQNTAEAITLRARHSGKASLQMFAALLSKAMQFPDQNAVFLVDGKPVITFWGCVKADGQIRSAPLDCLRPQDRPAPPIATPIVEPVAEPIAEPEPAPLPPVTEDPPRRAWWLLLLPAVLILAAAIWLLLPKPTAQPPMKIVEPVIKLHPKLVITPVVLQLPLAHAEVLPPPVITPVVVDRLALTLPAEDVKAGSTAFLNGKWRVTLAIKDPLTGKPPSLLYQFKNGKGTARIVQGDKVTCRVEVNAGLMQSGNLVINSRTKARCSDGSRYQMPELVCKQGDAAAAECSGRYGNSETVFPMTIKRESK
ncbi:MULTISPECIES: SrfA family protein [unclassified Serratia (in: enterobacteria)]|uniref:SrfA family protein n=1 Tax=unclassified Serratia (in: enterobacteria) TaxID=2647522 RepID=UPI000468AEDE|nr:MULTISPECIES: SrfA family protein [unclassified Serratia (in: enterobacteria)]